jgi:transcription elongation factor Elf1
MESEEIQHGHAIARSACMIEIDRRKSQRRATQRGGRRLEDTLTGKRCTCEAESLAVGKGARLVWQQCGICGEVWQQRQSPAADMPG